MQMQMEATQKNMHTGTVSMQMNHGGHEISDIHELLAESVTALDKMAMLRDHVQDSELAAILERQHQFKIQEYNGLLSAVQTGQAPAPLKYDSKLPVNIVYGMKEIPPVRPMQAATDITDESISRQLLVMSKASATRKTLTALETTNPVMRHAITSCIPNCIEMAYELFLWRNKHHFYQVPQFAEQDMQTIMNCFAPAQMGSQLTM